MTVADNTSRNQYTATPSQALFAYTFEIVDKDDIVVLINGIPLSEGTDYTVTGVGSDTGGNIVLTSGTTGGNIVTIYRDMPYARTQNYTNSGDFLASEVNSDFDNLWLAGEQTNRSFSQSIRKPITDSDSISMELPEAATRAGRVLTFDSNGAVSTSALSGTTETAISRQQFTGNGSTTAFTLTSDLGTGAGVVIYIDGVYQEGDTYSVSGTTLTFTEAPPTNASIEVVSYKISDIATIDSSSVTYTPAGTGAVQTTVQTKLRESVSVKDFGAVGDGVTDDASAINNALNFAESAGGGSVALEAGTYIVGSTIQIPDKVKLVGSGQKVTTIKLKNSANTNIIEQKDDGLGSGLTDLTVDGNQDNNTQGGVYLEGTNTGRGVNWTVERVIVTGTRNCVMPTGVKTCFFIGGGVWDVVKDVDVIDNDHAQIAMWIGASDGVYTGIFIGTNTNSFSGTRYGLYITGASNHFTNCYFGGSQNGDQVTLYGSSAAINKFTNCVFDNGGGNQLTISTGATRNQFVNCQFTYSSYTFSGTKYNVYNAVANSKSIFVGCKFDSSITSPTYDIPTYAYHEPSGVNGAAIIVGCDFSGNYVTGFVGVQSNSTTRFSGNTGYTFSNADDFRVNDKIDIRGTYNGSAPSTSSVPLLRVNNGGAISSWFGGTGYSYNWLQSIQDDGSNNLKGFRINPLGGDVVLGAGSSPVTPNSDGTQSLGASGARWSVVYATTGTINTSDEREKTFLDIEDAERTAALEIKANLRKFKFNHAIESKGDDARIHFGASAQQVGEILTSHGLNPDAYGFYCYDEWEADEDMPAGNRYGIRYDELLAFILAAL